MRPRQGSLPQRPFFLASSTKTMQSHPQGFSVAMPFYVGCPATLTQFSGKFVIQLSLPNWVNATWL